VCFTPRLNSSIYELRQRKYLQKKNNLTPKTKSEIPYSIPDSIIFSIINKEDNTTHDLCSSRRDA